MALDTTKIEGDNASSDLRFGSIAPGQHMPKQSPGDGLLPLAALRGRANLLESLAAMTAFGSSSH